MTRSEPHPPLDAQLTIPGSAFDLDRRIAEDRAGARSDAHSVTFEGFDVSDRDIPVHSHQTATLSLLVPRGDASEQRPAIVYIHGGGFVLGSRFSGIEHALPLARAEGAILATVEYALAPEHPFPAALDDCAAALRWVFENAASCSIDPSKVVVVGSSAGAALVLLTMLRHQQLAARVQGAMLIAPMLNGSAATYSARQVTLPGAWNACDTQRAWALLHSGPEAHRDPIEDAFASGALIEAIRGSELPPTFLEVGSVDGFRDDVVDLATYLWTLGRDSELHVWAGCFHGSALSNDEADVTKQTIATRAGWLRRRMRRVSG